MTTERAPATAARCVPLCGAGDHVKWWHHEVPCPVRQEHENAKREYDRMLDAGHPANRKAADE